MKWYDFKDLLDRSIGFPTDVLHAPVGLLLYLATALFLRRFRWGPAWALLPLFLLQALNEVLDARDWWRWTGTVSWVEAAGDTLATMVLPIAIAAFWMHRRRGRQLIDLATWKKAWALLDARERRNAWIVLGIVILAALSSAAMVGSVLPFLSVLADPERIRSMPALGWAYETGGFSSDYGFLVALGLASLAVIVLANVLQMFRTWAVARFTLMRIYTLSHRLLAAYLRQPYEYFLNHHTGEMSTQILSESQEAVNQFFRPAGEVMASMLTILAVVTLLLWINPVVAILAFVILGGLYGGTFLLSRRLIARMGKDRAAANRERFRLANEALAGVKDIKLLGREVAYIDRYRAPAHHMARSIVSVQVLGEMPQYVMQAVGFGGVILLCLLLLDPQALSSGAALGGILPLIGVFAFAGQRLLPELSRLYRGLTLLNAGGAAVDAVHRDLTGMSSGQALLRDPPAPLGLKRELRLDHLSYRYPDAERAGLRDVSLMIRAGERIGVVGTTGAGKTTLADIILGLLRPGEGHLIADGIEITDENLRAWQQTVGYVPQDIYLTDSSIAENIALGLKRDEIDEARLRRAAQMARIDQFVTTDLPAGYDTVVGERGVRLSGGQRQRIGIARALYHDAELIVFDEATSALDNMTEREVMAAIEALQGDTTILLIAHRLSTVRYADRLIYLQNGRCAGFGSWDELVCSNHAFRHMVENASSSGQSTSLALAPDI
ncbi:MAG: ABC transporter ATP-binding protein [Minwuia sp.]|uniref:ABC transporter ATP-binding protein n=1 Tax=Minwuia sp. TaxID=2493630 RepID=UPI003A857AA1